MPDGKHMLAAGLEAGHGQRDYLIDLSTGDSKAITPEGVGGTLLSPDGTKVIVFAKDGRLAIWALDGSGMRPVPGLDATYYPRRWSPDGTSIYVASSKLQDKLARVFEVNLATGKMQLWKTFGQNEAGYNGAGAPLFSADGSAYAYVYSTTLSEAYVATGLK